MECSECMYILNPREFNGKLYNSAQLSGISINSCRNYVIRISLSMYS